MPAKRALLVGIDAYAHIRPLDGCVNDSRLMRSVLVERFGFPEGNITQLLDQQATRDQMLAAFDALAAATNTDDVVVVHFAGHGSQMRDREGDEPSGFDSTLMPWDTGRKTFENRDISDDEVHLKLAALAAKTPHITFLVDACHSGTVTRDAFGAKTRSVERDLRPVAELPPSPIPGGTLARTRSGASGWLPLEDKYVLIAGCRDDEESKEYLPPEGGTHGALTYFLCQELRKATSRTTYRDVYEVVASRVSAYNPVQHPQMEGTADKVVFGVDDIAPALFVPVTSRVDGRVELAAGITHGMTVGSTFAVHPSGTKVHDAATELGEIVVRTLTPFTAQAEITRETAAGSITADMRAFETAHAFGDTTLAVQLVGADAEAAFKDILSSKPLIAVAPAGASAAVRIYWLPARTSVSPDDPVPQAGAIDEPRWAVVDATGELLMPLKPSDGINVVVQNLEKIAKFRRVLALDNPSVGSRLRGKVTIEVLRETSRGTFGPAKPDGGLVVVEEGQPVAGVPHKEPRVRFQITNTSAEELFVALVSLGTGSGILVPEKMKLPAGEQRQLTGPVSFPPNYPFVDLGDPFRGVDAVETLKLFVTREPIDLKGLTQAAVRSLDVAPPEPTTPFATALKKAAGASRAWEPETEAAAAPTPAHADDWATESRSYIVRRRAKALPKAGDRVAIGHAVVTAPALDGSVGTGVGPDGRDETAGFALDALRQALASADVAMTQTITIDGAQQKPASRGAAGPAPIAVQLKPPPDGYGQMVLASDELGVVSWSFAPAGPATRSVDGRTVPRTYHIHSDVSAMPPGQPASRGLIGIVGKKIIKELVFPIVRPMLGQAGASAVHWLESTRWPYRVRTFTPDNYTTAEATPIDRDGWTRLGSGRALLMVHGTFSRSHLAFAAMPQADIDALYRLYDGRVFSFDHLFLSEDPAENVRWLVSQMPDDAALDLDIVCHSRGGLVSRVLTEKQSEISLGSRRVRVGKVVLVGVPNAGTALADPAHVERLLDVFTNAINFLPDSLGTPVMTMLIEFAKLAAIGALDDLSGLQSMLPGGDFATWLNAPAAVGDTRYFAVASNVAPTDPGLRHFIRSRALTALLNGGNDLVVPSDGAFAAPGASLFPVPDPLLLEGESAVAHTKYFADAGVRRQVLAWLGQS